jgi:hypothetical protein
MVCTISILTHLDYSIECALGEDFFFLLLMSRGIKG